MAKIMIADDHVGICNSFKIMIRESGHEVSIVSHNGIDALSDFFKFRPDAAILDHRMPGMNGLDVARKIKEIDSNAIIMISTTMPEEIESVAGKMNITVIPKYVSYDQFVDAITRNLE